MGALRILAAWLLLCGVALAGQPPGITPDANGRVSVAKSYPSGLRAVCQSVVVGSLEGNTSTPSEYQEVTRVPCTAQGPISQLQLAIPTQTAIAGAEINRPNTVFYKASVEYGGGTHLFTQAGQIVMRADPTGSGGTLTDIQGVNIPAGSPYFIRYGTYLVRYPNTPAVVAVAGGALAASTTYYYELSCVFQGVESGPSAEFSAATTASNLTINVSWTATPSALGCDRVKVYRSITSGAETYLASVYDPGLTYADTGAVATVAGKTPAATPSYAVNDFLSTGVYSTAASTCGGSQTDVIANTTLSFLTAGPVACYVSAPPAILGDDITAYPVCGLGDSIQSGTGINSAAATPTRANWFVAPLVAAGYSALNLSIPQSLAAYLTGTGASQRLRFAQFCAYIVSNQVTNDLAASNTWQSAATAQVQTATLFAKRGKRYFITTSMPRVTSTDNLLTIGGQTKIGSDAARLNYNAWVRGGMQMLAGVPVLTGGAPTPYVAGYFDLAGSVEVNASNVPALNGGYWPVYPTAVATGTLNGTPTLTTLPSATALTAHALAGNVIKLTSGAASGQSCVVSDNTASLITCGGSGTTPLTIAPASGDTYGVFNVASLEGTHPTYYEQALNMVPAFGAWILQNLGAF